MEVRVSNLGKPLRVTTETQVPAMHLMMVKQGLSLRLLPRRVVITASNNVRMFADIGPGLRLGPQLERASNTRFIAVQTASGCSFRTSSVSSAGSTDVKAGASFRRTSSSSSRSSVARRSDSYMTDSGPMGVPKRRDATFAPASARLISDPSFAMVAEVPMQIGALSGVHRLRRRRTRIATPPPWRPR